MSEDFLYLIAALFSAILVAIVYWVLINKKEGFRVKIGEVFMYWIAGTAAIGYLLQKIFAR